MYSPTLDSVDRQTFKIITSAGHKNLRSPRRAQGDNPLTNHIQKIFNSKSPMGTNSEVHFKNTYQCFGEDCSMTTRLASHASSSDHTWNRSPEHAFRP
jgi:hypothetical protein